MGELVVSYLNYGLQSLRNICPNLMKRDKARELFEQLRNELKPMCTLPMNKQTKEEGATTLILPASSTC